MDDAVEEGSGRQYDCRGRYPPAVQQHDATDPAIGHNEVVDLALDHLEVRLRGDRRLHRRPVELAIGLGARSPHCRTLAAVEDTKLDAGLIRHAPHEPIEGVDLADKVPLAEAAYGRVAAHFPNGRKAMRYERRRHAETGRRRRRLRPRMPAADNDDAEVRHNLLPWLTCHRRHCRP